MGEGFTSPILPRGENMLDSERSGMGNLKYEALTEFREPSTGAYMITGDTIYLPENQGQRLCRAKLLKDVTPRVADTISERVEDLETQGADHETRIGAAESDIDTLEGSMTDAESDIDDLEGRMTTAEGDIDDLEGRMTTAEGDIDDLEGRMTTAEGEIDDHESRITTLEGL
jgi:chromosome segregation ATPase